MSKKDDKKGSFLYVTPVTGVDFGDSTKGGEYRIDKVTLFSSERFLRTQYPCVAEDWMKLGCSLVADQSHLNLKDKNLVPVWICLG